MQFKFPLKRARTVWSPTCFRMLGSSLQKHRYKLVAASRAFPIPPFLPLAASKQACLPTSAHNTSTSKHFDLVSPSHPPRPTSHFVRLLLPLPSIKHKGDRKDLPNLGYFSPISVPSYATSSTGNNHLWNSIFAASLSNHPLAIVSPRCPKTRTPRTRRALQVAHRP